MEEVNTINSKLTYWEAMRDQTTKEKEAADEQQQHFTMQNTVLVELVKMQQRR